MKELTIEEKAKRYDEVIERAKKWRNAPNIDKIPTYGNRIIEEILPELKESEDDKIRREIQSVIEQLDKDSTICGKNYDYNQWLSWLEKQKVLTAEEYLQGKEDVLWCIKQAEKHAKDENEMGTCWFAEKWLEKQGDITKLSEEEQNRFAKGVLSSCAMSFIDYLDAHKNEGKMCVSNGECVDIENAFHNSMWDRLHRYYCKYIEKQDSQNLANSTKTCKVEHKFKIGDEIKTDKEEPLIITKIDEEGYWSEDLFICGFDEEHLWDLVEPKFHEGDWVVCEVTCSVYQIKNCIENLNTHKYGYDITNGGYIGSDEANHYHLWTIQDAKDGDVLVDEYNNIGIYKEIEGIYWNSYIYLGCDGKLYDFSVGGMHEQTDTHPATQKQRDNLLKAMADAGWEFDFDKKELKKIEPIDEYEGLTDFERTVADVCIGFIGKELGWKQYIKDNADNLLKIAVKKFNAVQDDTIQINPSEYINDMGGNGCYLKNTTQTSTWSEEDKKKINRIYSILRQAADTHAFSTSCRLIGDKECMDLQDFLKSIKDRVTPQPKQEWSEGDEKIVAGLNNCIDELEEANGWRFTYVNNENVELCKIRNWLKLLKDRYTWKPSEEEMGALEHFVRSIGESGYSSPYDNNTKLLYSLLEQLKKLRGE